MPSPHETLKPCSDTRISEVLESQKPACDKPSASSASSATNRATSAETIMPMPCAKTAARRRHKYIRLSPANTDSLAEEQQTPKPSEFNCFGLLGSPHRCVFCIGLALCRLSSTSMVLGHTHPLLQQGTPPRSFFLTLLHKVVHRSTLQFQQLLHRQCTMASRQFER